MSTESIVQRSGRRWTLGLMFDAPVLNMSCNKTQQLPTPWWLAHATAFNDKALSTLPCKALSMVLASACENKSRHVVAKTLSKLLDNIFASVTLAGPSGVAAAPTGGGGVAKCAPYT